MRSTRPKPLHRLCGRFMVMYVIDALAELKVDKAVVVVGHGAERVTKAMQESAPESVPLEFVEQEMQKGTGDAASIALSTVLDPGHEDDESDDVLILPGDTPLIRAETLRELVRVHRESNAGATVLTAVVSNPTGYGRIVRSRDERVKGIVEELDATPEEKQINEINTSIYCFRRSLLSPALRRVRPENAQGELYLTDVIAVLHDAGYSVLSYACPDPTEARGVNDRAELAEAERVLRARIALYWLRNGVSMLEPHRVSLDGDVRIGQDVTMIPPILIQGNTVIGEGAEIGPNVHLVDCVVGEGARVEQTSARQAEIGAFAHVGPFAALLPGSHVPPNTVTGPFYSAHPEDDSPDEET